MKKVLFGVLGFIVGFVVTLIVLSLLIPGATAIGPLLYLAGGALGAWRAAKVATPRAGVPTA